MKKKLLGAFFALATIFSSQAQNVRVLGYFPQYRATSVLNAQYDKLTDIAFSFINPNANGSLKTNGYATDQLFGFDNNKFTVVKDGCQANGVNLWISLGGADGPEQRSARLNSVSGNTTYLNTMVTDLVAFCITNGLYGISVDWEFPKTNAAKANHVKLLEALASKIASSSNPNLKVSVAVGGEYKGSYTHFNYLHTDLVGSKSGLVDEWHIMAYDFPPSYGVNHSSLIDAEGCMDGWNNVTGVGNGIPYNQMLLGVPFYGRKTGGEIEYNNLTGNAATNFNSDVSGSWHYNGKSTLEAKIDLAVAKGAPGILIWDLGQDRSDQYSLLKVINDKVNTVCPIAKPNLGADRGVCAPNSITLDPGVTGSGLTFVWTKDGGSSIGSGSTLSVSSAGTYKVSISGNGCTKEDEVVVVSGSPLTTTGASGCDDETLSLTITNPASGKTYDWYDSQSAGTKVSTGTTYSDVFTSSATYYVEEKADGVVTYTTSPDAGTDPNAYWGLNAGTEIGQRLTVDADLTIKSFRMLVKGKDGVTFKFKVITATGLSLVKESEVFTVSPDATAGTYQYDLKDFSPTGGLALVPGDYFIYPEITSGTIVYQSGYVNENLEAGVFKLYEAMYTNYGSGFDKDQSAGMTHYGPFFKLVIETGANASCGRTAVNVTVQPCGPPNVTINSPTNTGKYYTQAPLINFDATITDEGSVSSVVFEVYNGSTLVATLPTNSSGSSYTASWQATSASTDYKFKVIATDNDGNTTTSDVDFDVDADVSAQDEIINGKLGVYPNPTTNEFNISFDLTSTNEVNVEVVNTIGAVVYSQKMGVLNGSQLINVNADLGVGFYFVNVKVGNNTVTTPLNIVK